MAPPSQDKLEEMAAPSEEQFAAMSASGDPSLVMQCASAYLKVTAGIKSLILYCDYIQSPFKAIQTIYVN